jgi:lipoprotein-anchoring transpeptidase ErfK/SrfK
VGRRIALLVLIALAAPAGGAVRARNTPAATIVPKDRPVLAHITAPIRHVVPAGTLVARIRSGRDALIRSTPNGPVVARVSSRTEFGSPQTFAVTRVLPGRRYRVVSTLLPNGRTGWIDAAPGTFTLSRARVTLEIDLSAGLLRVHRGARLVKTMRVGTGSNTTPTPTGRFAVTDELDGAAYSPVYGCCILALSAHQTHLPSGWTGGDRIAIHGGSTAGAVSTGCVHAATSDLRYLMRIVPLGALVVIHP